MLGTLTIELGTLMIGTIHADADNIPLSAPRVAGYVTGSADVKWTQQDWDRFPDAGKLRIDQSPELLSYKSDAASVADIGSGAGTIPAYVAACKERLAHGRLLWFHCSQDLVGDVSARLVAEGVPLSKCGVWVANWNYSELEANAYLGTTIYGIQVVAVQWASPSSHPNFPVPGGSGTLKEANLHLSATRPGLFEPRSRRARAGAVAMFV